VEHISQFIVCKVNSGAIRLTGANDDGKVYTYHDPCYLGRHNGIYDEPRQTLNRIPGLQLVEMPDAYTNSLCCGGGGGRIWMETVKGERFSDIRVEQAVRCGAEVLITACPYCISHFEDSRLTLNDSDTLDVKDITEVIMQAI
jgi:Fe-S oxidoreductase